MRPARQLIRRWIWLTSSVVGVGLAVLSYFMFWSPVSAFADQQLVNGRHLDLPELTLSRLTDVSDVALSGTVTSIRPAVLNTAEGDWASAARASDDLHQLYADLMPYTDIEIAVETILGARPQSAVDVSEYTDRVVVTLVGGRVEFVITPEQARAIGLQLQPPEPEGSLEGVGTPSLRYPDEDVKVLLQLEHGIDLAVGDRVMAFLRADNISLATGGKRAVLLSVIPEGAGLFRHSQDPAKVVNAGTGEAWDYTEVAAQATALSRATGAAMRLFDG